MAISYTNLAQTVTRLLTDNGQPMMLRRTTPGAIDPITDEETGASVSYADTRGVFTKIGTDYAMTHEVQSGDRMVTIDASAKPELTDKLVIGASALSIVNIIAVNPAGTPVAYKLHVRGVVTDTVSIYQQLRIGASPLSLAGRSMSLATDARSSVGVGSLALAGLAPAVQLDDRSDAVLQIAAGHLHVVSQPARASADVVAQAIASALSATGQQASVQTGNSIDLNVSVRSGTLTLSGLAATVTAITSIDAVANIGAAAVHYAKQAAQASAGAALDLVASAHEVTTVALSVTAGSQVDMLASVGAGSVLTITEALGATTTGVDGTATMTTQPTVSASDTSARIAFRVSGRSA